MCGVFGGVGVDGASGEGVDAGVGEANEVGGFFAAG